MGPEPPWTKIPEWFYDNKPISNEDVENKDELRIYKGIQKYFRKNISPWAVNEFLFGDNIKGVKLLNLESIGSLETQARGGLMLEATVKLPTGNNGTIRHAFYKLDHSTTFEYIKPEKRDEKFPGGFGRKFFRRYIPALRELNIKEINIKASSVPSEGMNGAYTWCFYGFTNKEMKGTLQMYVLYLEDYHGIYLDGKEINAIMKIERMRDLANSDLRGKKYAEEFLRAKRRGNIEWPGIVPDIFSEETAEMDEIIRYLSEVK